MPKPSLGASRRGVLKGMGALAGSAALPRLARAAGEPIKIGIIAEASALSGAAIPNAARMAVSEINAKGGVLGRPLTLVVYDDHLSSTDAIRAFQRLASQDKVAAVIGSFVSEIALALEPWAARLKLPFITPGATANQIAEEVHKDYARNKYTFGGWLNSFYLGESTADSAHDLLVDQLHMRTCAIMSEDAAWTTPLDASYIEFLPKAGLRVVDHVRFSPDTTDFTPIFDKIETKKPDVIITGMSHVGVVPTVQWTQSRFPIALYGVNAQASSGTFWKDTHGAAEGAITETAAGPASAITPKTVPFAQAYEKRYAIAPAYSGFATYDMVFVIASAIAREKSTDPARLVTGIEATDYIGTIGRVRFYGREHRFTHGLVYGPHAVQGVFVQWQSGVMRSIWPLRVADAKISYPAFVKLPG